MTTLKTNWQSVRSPATNAMIEQLHQHLDHRKAALSDRAQVDRILASFLAYQDSPFDVLVTELPKADKATVETVRDALMGPVLVRDSGRTSYRWRERHPTQVQTIDSTIAFNLTTPTGAIIRDESYNDRPFEHLGRIGYYRTELATIEAPFRTMAIFSGLTAAPSLRWTEINDEPQFRTPETEAMLAEFKASVLREAARVKFPVLPYGEAGFITSSGEALCRFMSVGATRLFNRHGLMPCMSIIGPYGRPNTAFGAAA